VALVPPVEDGCEVESPRGEAEQAPVKTTAVRAAANA